MTAYRVIVLARKHLGGVMEFSARLSLADAISLFDKGDYAYAKARAIDSLRYSVGIAHPDYQKASR